MKLVGYCTVCHRVRKVTVKASGWVSRNIVVGICDDCDAKRDERQEGRR